MNKEHFEKALETNDKIEQLKFQKEEIDKIIESGIEYVFVKTKKGDVNLPAKQVFYRQQDDFGLKEDIKDFFSLMSLKHQRMIDIATKEFESL